MFSDMRYIPVLSLIIIVLCSCGEKDLLHLPLGTAEQPFQQTHRLLMVDKNIRNTLYYVNSENNRLPGGQILVRVNLQNQLDTAVWADIMIEFQDADSMVVDQTTWMPTRFAPKMVTTIKGTSISPYATKHVVLLKDLRTENGRGTGPAEMLELQ